MMERGAEAALNGILPLFDTRGKGEYCVSYGCGHINQTYYVRTDTGMEYILQRINRRVFPDIPGLMENIASVTGHLYAACPDSRRVLTLVPAGDGGRYVLAGEEYWRLYVFVTRHIVLQRAEDPRDLRTCAGAFGRFLASLKDFPAASLHEVIPRFHDPADRVQALRFSAREDRVGRARECRREMDFLLERQQEMDLLTRLRREGTLPVRVTHNDTKVNNVLLDQDTRQELCDDYE